MSNELFPTQNQQFPKELLNSKGGVKREVIQAWNNREEPKKAIEALAWVSKLRRNEYSLVKRITKDQVILSKGLKGSSEKRDLARIEPFFSFVQANKVLVIEALAEYCYSRGSTQKIFKELGASPRRYEKATITFIAMNNHNQGALKVSGHKNPKNLQYYTQLPNYNIEQVREALKEEPKLLILFNGLLEAFNQHFEALKEELTK